MDVAFKVGEIMSLKTGEKVSMTDVREYCNIFDPNEDVATLTIVVKHAEHAIHKELNPS